MGIENLIANPTVSPIGEMASAGMDARQNRKMNNLDFLIKQFGYKEALKSVSLNDMKRELETGATEFALGKQKERQERQYNQEVVDDEFKFKEQIARAINNPASYKRYAEMKMLPPEFLDQDGNALPFEKTVSQRADLSKQAIDSTPHVRDKQLADIKADAMIPSYGGSDVTNFQRDAGFDLVRQFSKDRDWKIGKLTSKDPTDIKQVYRAITELSSQIAAQATSKVKGGKAPNENALRQRLAEIADETRMENPKNKEAWGFKKWAYTDEVIDWDAFNQKVKEEFGIDSTYSSPITDERRSSQPAFKTDTDTGGIPTVSTQEEYDQLKPGQEYIDPSGKKRKKAATK